jgi:ABC-type sugar transport system substrate-binding protein
MSMSNSGGQSSNDGARAGETDITRRSAILRAGRVAGGLAVFPGLLAACGSDDKAASTGAGGTTSTATTKPAPLTKNGTTRASFKPYDKSVPPGPKTPLPKKVATNFPAGSAYFDDFSKNVEKAVTDRGFKFSSTQWETDVAQNLAQLSQLQQTGVGAVVAQVQDEKGEAATLQKMIDKGICVVVSVAGPSTLQVIADQYKAGRTQGDQAAKWIKANLGGKAKVVVFNDDKIAEVLIPRGKGRVDGAKSAGPGVEIVANQSIKQLTAEEGNQMARTILQAHPDANVWMADDDTAIGVVSALKAAGKKPDDKIYVSGFNGQRNALEAVKEGGLFRESIGFPNAVYTYAVGQFCCDWIEGKSIPSVMDLNILVGTPDTIDELLAADSDPKSAYKAGVAKYVTLLGNTSYWKPSYTPTGITS